jgi:four helix bundle protein
MKTDYDLEERLLDYSARIIRLVEQLPGTRTGNHIAGQLLRSGTSPLPNHGEAQAARAAAG